MGEIIKLVNDAISCSDTWLEMGISNKHAKKLKTELKELKQLETKLQQIREYCEKELKWSRNDGNDYWAGKNNGEQIVATDILEILNSGGAE